MDLMATFSSHIIKSFKHDGHLHRMWLENALVPDSLLHDSHKAESMMVLINCQTKIVEADGKEWVSRIPGVSFFIPSQWFNVVALLEDSGVRYYCNVASPPFLNNGVITYIDYDLDVIRMPNGAVHVVDQEEYEQHKLLYRYSSMVDHKVKQGLKDLLKRIDQSEAPFHEERIQYYFREWEKWKAQGTEA
jgi:protein associated with RNAse G/E